MQQIMIYCIWEELKVIKDITSIYWHNPQHFMTIEVQINS